MATQTATIYNHEKYFESKISPLMLEIKKLCIVEHIPFFAGFAVSNNEEKTNYKYDILGTGSSAINLTDDRIERHLSVARGFRTSAFLGKDGEEMYLEDYITEGVDEEIECEELTENVTVEPSAPVATSRNLGLL